MAKRVTYILSDKPNRTLNTKHDYGDLLHKFESINKGFAQEGYAELPLTRIDWEKLGKPSTIRVTVTAIDPPSSTDEINDVIAP